MSEYMQRWTSGAVVGVITGLLLAFVARESYWPIHNFCVRCVCRWRGHDWDYFDMTNLDGTPADFRCCLRCERSEDITHDVYTLGKYGDRYDGVKVARLGGDKNG
jgi:hypothetical protein